MSSFDQRWQQLVARSQQAAPEPDPAPPRQRWPVGQPRPSPAERRGLWLAGGLAAAAWLVALWLTPLLVRTPQRWLPASPLAMSQRLPPLPHPPSVGTLVDDAFRSLTTTPMSTIQDLHL